MGPYNMEQAITTQPFGGPQKAGFANRPIGPSEPGIGALQAVDELSVKQVEYYKDVKRYHIMSRTGERLFTGEEISGSVGRRCCRPANSLTIILKDASGKEALQIVRRCGCCCCERIVVEAPPGNLIGKARQQCVCCHPKYNVKNNHKEVVLKTLGPPCTCCFCGGKLNAHFEVVAADGRTTLGNIINEFIPFHTDSALYMADDQYSVTFPMNMDTQTKALVLGTSLVVDYNYFMRQELMDELLA